jgi:hypothetical protein
VGLGHHGQGLAPQAAGSRVSETSFCVRHGVGRIICPRLMNSSIVWYITVHKRMRVCTKVACKFELPASWEARPPRLTQNNEAAEQRGSVVRGLIAGTWQYSKFSRQYSKIAGMRPLSIYYPLWRQYNIRTV